MIYTNVSRGLFEAHKIIYSFLITTGISRKNGSVKDEHWNVLLRGAGPLSPDQQINKPSNPEPKVISNLGWDLLYFMDVTDVETYGGLT